MTENLEIWTSPEVSAVVRRLSHSDSVVDVELEFLRGESTPPEDWKVAANEALPLHPSMPDALKKLIDTGNRQGALSTLIVDGTTRLNVRPIVRAHTSGGDRLFVDLRFEGVPTTGSELRVSWPRVGMPEQTIGL